MHIELSVMFVYNRYVIQAVCTIIRRNNKSIHHSLT